MLRPSRRPQLLSIWRGRLAMKYIFFEMVPTFLLGVIVFVFIILMFQSFRLTEYIIVHGADLRIIGQMLVYLSISFLPVVLPMTLLFTVLLTYGRMSADSEIVALKSLGLNMAHITTPAVALAALTCILSAQTSFYLAPWGNRQMEVMIHRLANTKPEASIREGIFSEGFFDLVVYANEVDSKNGRLEKVFIYDERDPKSPTTIIAKEGRLIKETTLQGHKAFLRLYEGNIHRTHTADQMYTKVDFNSYDINLFNPISFSEKSKTPLSYNLDELRLALDRFDINDQKKVSLLIELHRRSAISVACFIFALLGVGLGTVTNRRQGRTSGFVLSLGVIVFYWILYAASESLAKNQILPVWISIWVTNIVFLWLAFLSLRKASET